MTLTIKEKKYLDLYEGLQENIPGSDFIFMNYGFLPAPRAQENLRLREEHQKYRFHVNLLSELIKGVNLKNKNVLEVSSGRGGNCAILAEYLGPRRVTGIDISSKNIRFSKKVHKHIGLSFKQGRADKLPFADRTFDVVINLESSNCYPDRRRFFAEVHRVLKPSGVFCYADIFDSRSVKLHEKWLRGEGFSILRSRDITRGVSAGCSANEPLMAEIIYSAAAPTAKSMNAAMGWLAFMKEVNRNYFFKKARFHLWTTRKTNLEWQSGRSATMPFSSRQRV